MTLVRVDELRPESQANKPAQLRSIRPRIVWIVHTDITKAKSLGMQHWQLDANKGRCDDMCKFEPHSEQATTKRLLVHATQQPPKAHLCTQEEQQQTQPAHEVERRREQTQQAQHVAATTDGEHREQHGQPHAEIPKEPRLLVTRLETKKIDCTLVSGLRSGRFSQSASDDHEVTPHKTDARDRWLGRSSSRCSRRTVDG